jgi:6-phosphogluconate dehydrogenase
LRKREALIASSGRVHHEQSGFVGLGIMGTPIAANLMAEGHELSSTAACRHYREAI